MSTAIAETGELTTLCNERTLCPDDIVRRCCRPVGHGGFHEPQSVDQFNYNHFRSNGYSFAEMKGKLGAHAIGFERKFQGEAELETIKRDSLVTADIIRSALTRYVDPTADQMRRWQDAGLCVWCGSEPNEQFDCVCRRCDSCTQTWISSTAKDSDDGRPPMEDCPECAPLTEWPKGSLAIRDQRGFSPLAHAIGSQIYDAGDDVYYFMVADAAFAVELARELATEIYVDDGTVPPLCLMDPGPAARRLATDLCPGSLRYGVALPETARQFEEHFLSGLYPELEAQS